MTSIALRTIPTPGSIILNQARSLFLNHRWELLFMGLVTFVYQLSTMNAAGDEVFITGDLMLFMEGAPSLPMQFILVLFGAFWAFRIWEGLRAGEKSVFMAYPAGRVTHQMLRITAGAAIFIAVIAFFWLLGATVSEIFAPGYSWFSIPEYRGSGWFVSLIGLLNVFLYASILSLLFRRPEIWFLAWIPVTASVLIVLLYRTGLDFLGDVLSRLLAWPSGAMAGFGFQFQISRAIGWELPSLLTVLLWTVIFSGGLYLVASIHRED
jgi:hypothetical protein